MYLHTTFYCCHESFLDKLGLGFMFNQAKNPIVSVLYLSFLLGCLVSVPTIVRFPATYIQKDTVKSQVL